MRLKIELYILSLWVLFFLIFVNKITFPTCFVGDCEFIGFRQLLQTNIITTVCLLGMVAGVIIYYRFRNRIMKSGKQGPWEVTKVESISFENLSFLATYIIPLLCFDLDFNLDEKRNAIMLVLVLIAIGAIYVKANLYYTNPSLALLDFRIYRIEYKYQDKTDVTCTLLIRDKLNVGDKIHAKHIDEGIYYARKSKS